MDGFLVPYKMMKGSVVRQPRHSMDDDDDGDDEAPFLLPPSNFEMNRPIIEGKYDRDRLQRKEGKKAYRTSKRSQVGGRRQEVMLVLGSQDNSVIDFLCMKILLIGNAFHV